MTPDHIAHLRGRKCWQAAQSGCTTCINIAVTEANTPFLVITAGTGGSLNPAQGQEIILQLQVKCREMEKILFCTCFQPKSGPDFCCGT